MKKAGKMILMASMYLLLGVSYSLMFIGSALVFMSKIICYQDVGKNNEATLCKTGFFT